MLPVTRRWWLLVSFGLPVAAGLSAQALVVRLDKNKTLHISAPAFQFLTGKPLDRLKDGASVAFLGQLSLSFDVETSLKSRMVARFALSYDIWEERFSVTRFATDRNETTRRTASHLSAQAAQNWVLESMTLDTSTLPQDKPFWVRFELRVEDPRDDAGIVGDPGINLTRLVEIFSRPARAAQPRWQLESGQLRLSDLRREG
jgi:hypothetical protein